MLCDTLSIASGTSCRAGYPLGADVSFVLFDTHPSHRAIQGKYQEADPLYLRSIGIFEQTLGPDHPVLAETLHNRAELMKAQVRGCCISELRAEPKCPCRAMGAARFGRSEFVEALWPLSR